MRIIVLLFLELCPLTGSLAWCTPLPPGHAASRPLADSIVGSAAEGCLGLHLRLFLPPLRGGGRPEGRPDVEEILKRSLERTDHVALWESDELGGEVRESRCKSTISGRDCIWTKSALPSGADAMSPLAAL
jgi:hypothetical protein